MLIAIDKDGNRILPTKGAKGFCQLCLSEVLAICGEINIHHWRHKNLNFCDSWKESESEWHREWKNEFPKEWQEKIITENFEKHIADIKTPNGLVLELQNSSISSVTIKIRESFYNDIYWLINANEFKDNFSIRSAVTTILRNKDRNHNESSYYGYSESYDLSKLKEKHKKTENKLISLSYDYEQKSNLINSFEKFLLEIKENIKEYFQGYYYSSVIYDFKTENDNLIKIAKEKIKNLNDELTQKEFIITTINSLKKCNLSGFEKYRYIKTESINASSFEKCIMIEKEKTPTFFPNILKFKSKEEFERIKRNQNYYILVDTTEKNEKTINEIAIIKKQIENLNSEIEVLKDNTEIELVEYLKQKIENEKIERKIIDSEYEKKTYKLYDLSVKIKEMEATENEQHSNFLKKLELEHKEDRVRIMKKYKGIYLYEWKHRRKSWDFSERKIFLDFEKHIFEIVDENTLRKIEKNDFINLITNWKK